MVDEAPTTDDREPALLVTTMIDHVLALATTWTVWDGRPLHAEERIYTPHKAIRRVTDHLVDHHRRAGVLGRTASWSLVDHDPTVFD